MGTAGDPQWMTIPLGSVAPTYVMTGSSGATINVKVEKNSRGYNWEATVQGAATVAEALALVQEAEQRLREIYGDE